MTRQLIAGLGILASGVAILCLSSYVAAATGESTSTHTLHNVLALALEHNPTMAGAQGAMRQSRGQQVSAGAYLNPSISGAAGRGSIRDPSTGVKMTERTVTVEQPLEWQGKRRARQQAADAGAAGASAAMEETRLNVIAEAKVAFYHVLFAQRDVELAGQNLTMVEDVLRTVKARVAAGDATLFETMKATVEVQKAQKEVARAQNALVVVRLLSVPSEPRRWPSSFQRAWHRPQPRAPLQFAAHLRPSSGFGRPTRHLAARTTHGKRRPSPRRLR